MSGFSIETIARLLPRLNTAPLRQGDLPTRALVVVNPGPDVASGLATFRAAFPVRAAVGAQPVVLRDAAGILVPSRLAKSRLEESPDLPAGRLLWTLSLEFRADSVPANGWRAYSAAYSKEPAALSPPAQNWQSALPLDLPVYETDTHVGDLPLIGSFDIMDGDEIR
jgi:hypothetical protein